jgi:hypothetical protein
MRFENRHIRFLTGTALSAFLLLASGAGRGQPTTTVDKTIQHLMAHVAGSGLTFIRNAERYTSVDAAEHMNKKYQHFKDEIETPEDFIELCATKSLLSGAPYLVIDAQGNEMKTGDWLRSELESYRSRGQ